MSKSDPEHKIFRENSDRVLEYFIERFKFIADELIYDVFWEMNNERIDQLVNVMSRNMLDFCPFIKFYADVLQQVNPTVSITGEEDQQQDTKPKNIFSLMIDTLS
jgi:hypothetical protein